MPSRVQPPSFTLSLHALLTFPYRLCNPPAAAGNVRSCKVTPLIKITLDDVLNKRHLPPLTLKDFEEWLVFVEGNPQYLYFILWLKEYDTRYAAWLAESGCTLPAGSPCKFPSTTTLGVDPEIDTPCSPRGRDLSYVNLIPSSPPLALFFTRAKQTFLDPTSNSPYALGPAALLALTPSTHSLTPSIPHFTTPEELKQTGGSVGALPASLATQPHPHPKELAPLANFARKVLKESLERFAETACHNVGSRRAWCGIAGGTLITLVTGILPTLVAFFFANSRWWRVVGWLGCWIGGTVIVSSLHGICMMIYLFGDLRQLRSFELARPSISGPRAIARARPRLKSLFTKDGEGAKTSTGGTDTGTGTGSPLAQSSILSPASAPNVNNIPTNLTPEASKKAKEVKRPWSAASASITSTGTPVVHLGPGAFKIGVGTGTMESDVTTTGTVEIGVGSIEAEVGALVNNAAGMSAGGVNIEDDFGIEISPAYYEPGPDPSAIEGGETERRASVRSAGSGSKIGFVMRWVLGKRASFGTSTSVVVGEKAAVVSSEKNMQGQSQTRSHAGTFGIRSWRGGLGSLPERSGDIERDNIGIEHTTGNENLSNGYEPAPEYGLDLHQETMLTAEFITHDYPQLVSEVRGEGGPLDASPSAVHTATAKVDEGQTTPAMQKRVSSSPVKFDFDKLPSMAVARRMSSPSTFPFSSISPLPEPDHAIPHHPLPSSLYVPEARLTTPAPASLCTRTTPNPVVRETQWWDTCPRHPAVEAALTTQTHKRPPSLTIQTHNLTRPASLTHPSSLAPPDPESTRPTSLASSDVHSRVRVHVHGASFPHTILPTSSPKQQSARSKISLRSRNTTETWRMRFRRVTAVPAFGPLTRILEPVVSRGQWEIVVRSACVAALSAWIFIGSLVALPEIR